MKEKRVKCTCTVGSWWTAVHIQTLEGRLLDRLKNITNKEFIHFATVFDIETRFPK